MLAMFLFYYFTHIEEFVAIFSKAPNFIPLFCQVFEKRDSWNMQIKYWVLSRLKYHFSI